MLQYLNGGAAGAYLCAPECWALLCWWLRPSEALQRHRVSGRQASDSACNSNRDRRGSGTTTLLRALNDQSAICSLVMSALIWPSPAFFLYAASQPAWDHFRFQAKSL